MNYNTSIIILKVGFVNKNEYQKRVVKSQLFTTLKFYKSSASCVGFPPRAEWPV